MLVDRDDLAAEVRREKRPSGGPAVALLETTKGQNGLLAVSPTHAGAFQPLCGERLARRFDVSTIKQFSRQFLGESCDMSNLLSTS